MNKRIRLELKKLKQQEARLIRLAGLGMQADQGAMFPFDFWTNAAINRGIQLSSGFRSSIRKHNAICSGALLRLQIDTALRYSAGWLVQDPHKFVGRVMSGEQINRMKDRSGEVMTDSYLVKVLSVEHPWITKVYKRTSSYVHFSDTHIWSTLYELEGTDNKRVKTKVGAADKEGLSDLYMEMVMAFQAATTILINYVEGWVFTKEAVGQRKT